MVEYLLERGADIEHRERVSGVVVDMQPHVCNTCAYICARTQGGAMPLMNAAFNGYIPVVEYLLERGAEMEAKNKVHETIISYEAIHVSHMSVHCE